MDASALAAGGLSDGRPSFKAPSYRVAPHARASSQFSKADAFAMPINFSGSSGIRGLLLSRGPPDISRAVVSVIVNALKRRALRPLPHIGEEIFERISPFSAHGYPPSAVTGVENMLLVKAPRLSADPTVILSRWFAGLPATHATGVTVLSPSLNLDFTHEAPATATVAGGQATPSDTSTRAAFALAIVMPRSGAIARDNKPVSESLASKLSIRHHLSIKTRKHVLQGGSYVR